MSPVVNRTSCIALACLALSAACGGHPYTLETVEAEAPVKGLSPAEGKCAEWSVTRVWGDTPGPADQGKADSVRVRCLHEHPTTAPAPEPRSRIDLTLHGESIGGAHSTTIHGPKLLDAFEFKDGDGWVEYRDAKGTVRSLDHVQKIELYPNIIIARTTTGAGTLIPPDRFLGGRWAPRAPTP